MILDDIEFDALNRADILLLAHLRPRLWSAHLHASGLCNSELRERLIHEVERRAAQTANERARLAFERNEAAPFPNFACGARLAEFDQELALERVRLNWLDCAQTAQGIEQLNRIENVPLRTNNPAAAPNPAWAKITFGLAREFSNQDHSIAYVGAFLADYLQRQCAQWSVTLAPTSVHYASQAGSRDEAGVELGLINDPRAPLDNYELARRALTLADQARQTFGQHRLCVTFPDCVVMLEGEDAPSPFQEGETDVAN